LVIILLLLFENLFLDQNHKQSDMVTLFSDINVYNFQS